jgi:hypothetical protein
MLRLAVLRLCWLSCELPPSIPGSDMSVRNLQGGEVSSNERALEINRKKKIQLPGNTKISTGCFAPCHSICCLSEWFGQVTLTVTLSHLNSS